MSTDEVREEKIRLTMKAEDVERHLNALHVKAHLQAEALIGLVSQLRKDPARIYRDGQSALHSYSIEKLWHIDDSTVRALELKSIVEVTNEIRKETLALT